MSESRRGGAFWNDEATFDMYATTNARTYTAPGDAPLVAPDVLKHPSHNKAPVSAALGYALEEGDLGLDHLRAREEEAKARVEAAEAARKAARAAGEAKVAETAAAGYGYATRPLRTMDPSQLPFGTLGPVSETHAAFTRVRPAGVLDEPAITLSQFEETQSQEEKEGSDRPATALGSVRPSSSSSSSLARPPSSFAPVRYTGMQSTYAATHVPQKDPCEGYVRPRNEIAATAKATAPVVGAEYNMPDMYRPSSAAIGRYANLVRPVTAPAGGRRRSSRTTRDGLATRVAGDPNATRGPGHVTGAKKNLSTEYCDAFDTTRPFNRIKPHHLW